MGFFEKDNREIAENTVKKHKNMTEVEKNIFKEILTNTGKVSKDTENKLKHLSTIFAGKNTQDMLIAENLIIISLLDELVNGKNKK